MAIRIASPITPHRVGAHVRRYPRWYGIAVVWILGMILLPVVEHTPLAAFVPSANEPSPTTSAAESPTTVTAVVVDHTPSVSTEASGPSATPPGPAADPVPSPPTTRVDSPPTTVRPESPPDTVVPELLDQLLDSLPPVPGVPPLPGELEPLARALAPIVLQGCSFTGLAQVVLVVAGPSLDGIPIERILPYLSIAATACANFPLPETYTICAADEPLVIDLLGITRTAPPLGLGIDQIEAMETLLGLSNLGFSDALREQLDCRVVER